MLFSSGMLVTSPQIWERWCSSPKGHFLPYHCGTQCLWLLSWDLSGLDAWRLYSLLFLLAIRYTAVDNMITKRRI